MSRILYIFLFHLLLFLVLSPGSVSSVTTSINDIPQEISSDPFVVTVSIHGASDGNNYMKIDLFKNDTSNYFGETFNGADWKSGGDFAGFPSVTISEGSWSGQIQARVGTPSTTDYPGPGTYKIRIRRYTASGNYSSSEANQGSRDLAINLIQTPTPTVTPTPTKEPTPSTSLRVNPSTTLRVNPTSTPVIPTSTRTPTPTKTPTPTTTPPKTPTPTKTPTPIPNPSIASSPTAMKIASLSSSPRISTPSPTSFKKEILGIEDERKQTRKRLPIYLVLIPLFLSILTIISVFLKIKRQA